MMGESTVLIVILWALTSCAGLFWLVVGARALQGALRYPPVEPGPEALVSYPPVTVCVPARNEERHILATLEALIAQDYRRLEIRVIDDDSSDATLAIARRVANTDSRVTVLRSAGRPRGWLGKNWALHQAAASVQTPWLVFVDADVVLHPHAIRRAIEEASKRNAGLLSFLVRLELKSFWQRLVSISFAPLAMALVPLTLVNDPRSKVAYAIGGVMAFRSEVYRRIGGHRAVANEVLEDTELARRVKNAGEPLFVLPAQSLASTHYYGSREQIWNGIRKNLYTIFDYDPRRLFWASFATWTVVFLPVLLLPMLPLFDAQEQASLGVVLNTLGALSAMSVLVVAVALITGSSPLYALAFPLGAAFILSALWRTAYQYHFGSGIQWKGRAMQPSELHSPRGPRALDQSGIQRLDNAPSRALDTPRVREKKDASG